MLTMQAKLFRQMESKRITEGKDMAVGIVRTIEVDGKLYVDADDYQSLLKRYEDAVGTKTNEQIIAELGVDEIPKTEINCASCRHKKKTGEQYPCNVCCPSNIMWE